MNTNELLAHVHRLLAKIKPDRSIYGTYSEVCEFLRLYIGPQNAFLVAIQQHNPANTIESSAAKVISENLQGLISSIEAGVQSGISPKRQAELDVVSDFLGMAHQLLETTSVHPASAAVLIGATLEEFLRTWIEAASLSLGARKPGLEAYSAVLRDAELITKQDGKDITSWAGVRNHAAHGEWEHVSDRQRVSLMLEGVNLFIRRYTQ